MNIHKCLLFAASIALAVTTAQAQAPAAGTGGAGGVGASVSQPTTPQGKTPPGTPNAPPTRDAAGTAVISKTQTPGGAVPGNTGGADSGVKKQP